MKEKVQHGITSNTDTVKVIETKNKSTNSLNDTYRINIVIHVIVISMSPYNYESTTHY